MQPSEAYDAVIVGTGPASSFFLHRFLGLCGPRVRILVVERGRHVAHASQLQQRGMLWLASRAAIANQSPEKPWVFATALGGSTNLWWGSTPRFLAEDFEMRSRYGVGADWPLGYADLEPYYLEAERLMAIAGPSEDSPFERSGPYPQPAHRMSLPERRLKELYPDEFFPSPCARPTLPIPGRRAACCGNGVCGLCPIDSKFTVLNGLAQVFQDPRVELRLESTLDSVETRGAAVTSVTVRHHGVRSKIGVDLVALGGNAIFNPHILLRSGLTHPRLGRGLHEQVAVSAEVMLDGLTAMQGGTAITGHGYMLYRGERRRERAAVLLETHSRPVLRDVRGKWQMYQRIICIGEDLPQTDNCVTFDPEQPDKPSVHYVSHSDYAERALNTIESDLQRVLSSLPVEAIRISKRRTEGHILGTTAMGSDPRSSVIDRDMRHHAVRNLILLGGGAFPTSSPSNPTLTIAALSLRAADRIGGIA